MRYNEKPPAAATRRGRAVVQAGKCLRFNSIMKGGDL